MASADTLTSSLPLAYSVGIIFFHIVFKCIARYHDLCFEFMTFFRSLILFNVVESKSLHARKIPDSDINEEVQRMSTQHVGFSDEVDAILDREDVEMVMANLGIACNLDDDKISECLGSDKISVLFAELEPSLDEVKEAFCVFDANGDGFIDAEELQRVLRNLGFGGVYNLHACEVMIRAVSKNGDARIDFSEFFKFMENSLSFQIFPFFNPIKQQSAHFTISSNLLKPQMEMTSADSLSPSLPLAYSVGILFFHILFNWVTRYHKLCFEFMSFCGSLIRFKFVESKSLDERKIPDSDINEEVQNMTTEHVGFSDEGDVMLDREDVEMVMARLGIACNSDGDKINECFGSDEISVLFAELEPSLEEVKEAFCLFDTNGDGFIDAEELQRILRNLGFGERYNLHACEMMIRAVSKKGDARIDFSQFMKFMENSLS
ncbi:uncharacterized protein LOC131237984 [Magnolia sinica]|uniref:uncharacterized protein LOC131237984 n=1 Tax=Magnolia sinica TaxID=86752 RepID=UPI0026588926|nr:uncharacterized protein LOC131237984 [Magnolia sinica]